MGRAVIRWKTWLDQTSKVGFFTYGNHIYMGAIESSQFSGINQMLHHLRGQKLSEMPEGIERLVSVGCSGTWYFEWIEEMYGAVESHIGVEYYMPKPYDLPQGIRWVANTAGHMPDIDDNSADAIFSGQNLEHLWPEEIAGFFLECNRILEHGGLLVVDSPNRRITERLNWTHPEHTIEITVSEARDLCYLAGFDVNDCKGIWLCEDPASGRLFKFDESSSSGEWNLARRIREADRNPEFSFIWWLEARKSQRPAKPRLLREAVDEIFSVAWQERSHRMQTIVAEQRGNWYQSEGHPGVIMFGPYIPLPAGSYDIVFHLKCQLDQVNPGMPLGRCDVISASSLNPIREEVIVDPALGEDGTFSLSLNFSLETMTFGLQFRVIGFERINLSVCRQVDIHASNNIKYPLSVFAREC